MLAAGVQAWNALTVNEQDAWMLPPDTNEA